MRQARIGLVALVLAAGLSGCAAEDAPGLPALAPAAVQAPAAGPAAAAQPAAVTPDPVLVFQQQQAAQQAELEAQQEAERLRRLRIEVDQRVGRYIVSCVGVLPNQDVINSFYYEVGLTPP